MPITTDLRENGRVIYLTMTDPWDVIQYLNTYPMQNAILSKASSTIHTLLDLTASKRLPDNLLRARTNSNINHPKSGYYVLVGLNLFGQTLAQTTARLVRFDRMKFFATTTEALTFLRNEIAKEDNATVMEATQSVAK